MSTKRIDKSVIEGGCTNRNTWERRHSHSAERASRREFCSRAKLDTDSVYDDYFIKGRQQVYKEFNDKLGPMYRWLHHQVGKPWNDVRSEIFKKFDSRTTAGSHIVYGHLLSSVEVTPDLRYKRYSIGVRDFTISGYSNNEFYVDDDGVLRHKTYISRRSQNKIPKFNIQSIVNWLRGRAVGKIGNKLFWFVPVDKSKKYGGTNHQWKVEWGANTRYQTRNGLYFLCLYQEPIYCTNKEGVSELVEYKPSWRRRVPTFRQDRKLTDKEIIFWNSIPEYYQIKILEYSPTYPNPPKFDYYNNYY